MRSWTFTFFILTVIAGLVGFTDLASMIAQFSKSIFFIAAMVCIAAFLYYSFKKAPFALSGALILLAITTIAGIFAFTQFTEAMVYIAKISFYIFLVLFIFGLIMQTLRKRV